MLIALGGVIVNDVENNFDARGVKCMHHFLEFMRRSVWSAGCVARVGCKETKGIVAPVI